MYIIYQQAPLLVMQPIVYQSVPYIRTQPIITQQPKTFQSQMISSEKSRTQDEFIENINKKIEIIDSRISQICKSLPPKSRIDKQNTNSSQDDLLGLHTPRRYKNNYFDNSNERIRISKKLLEEQERNSRNTKATQSTNKVDKSFQTQSNQPITHEIHEINKKTVITKKIIYMGEEALYEGQTDSKGRKQGIGTLFDQNGKIIYTGQWKDDAFWGKGKLNFREEKTKKLTLKQFINFSGIASNRETYSGNFINGEIEGIGQMQFGDAFDSYFVYYGTFRKGVFHGKGCVLSNSGKETLNGEWINGRHV